MIVLGFGYENDHNVLNCSPNDPPSRMSCLGIQCQPVQALAAILHHTLSSSWQTHLFGNISRV